MHSCIFCKIIVNKLAREDIIYEDERVLVMLDMDRAVKGHTLVVWKEHHDNISDLTPGEFRYFSRIVHRIEKALLEVLKADKSIILKSGGLISHFHFHIYPVKKETSWDSIKDIFDKKVSYTFKPAEKENLLKKLKLHLSRRDK